MKPLYIPLLVLAFLLSFSLWTGRYVDRRVQEWTALLDVTDQYAQQEQWEDASRQLRQTYANWNRSQTFFHTILEHQELDEAEGLFATAFAACDERDVPDFHAAMAQLVSKLQLLAETQSISIKNVL